MLPSNIGHILVQSLISDFQLHFYYPDSTHQYTDRIYQYA